MGERNTLGLVIKAVGLVLLVIVLPLVAGYALSLLLVPTPQIAVIRVEGDIWGYYSESLSDLFKEVGDDPAVKAVILEVVSPGGEVTASESLYFDVLKLRERKPVIASVNELAASGAYYVASAADQIFAKPASLVGNIGVISFLPEPDFVDEQLLTTGPFKLSGGPQVEYVRQMEMMKNTFLAAILAQREDRLTVDTELLSRGEIYLGLQAQKMGIIDQVGSRADAITSAAEMAKLRTYDVVDRSPTFLDVPSLILDEPEGAATAATVIALPDHLPPGFYYRYVEPPQ